ncbi:PEP-CTERM sorting domain-containing protein [Adhaeretor mobilis]|uniref:PEP-CTERM motif protein n=1 Tax=Adhaeretor mobilis TaxID=1930276 RepID=A0A517MT56_9BACT|nr:PEP-CTERM sorting domain-containing protein [Adhaeretor mobilis]QDS98071.1 PEP-CTERM motif protein [Adhaeretor mobilis]
MKTCISRGSPFYLILFALSSPVLALPTQVVHFDTPDCDPLLIPMNVDELGDVSIFPSDEALTSGDLGQSTIVPCPPKHLGGPNAMIDIRNLSGRSWSEVWYVASPGTSISNYDGEANDSAFSPLREAFRIDNLVADPGGSHHPLLFESMNPDGIWEPFESWQFVLQDYVNSSGLPPNAINSLGVGNASSPDASGAITSSGSIIAIELIPEPASIALLLMGLVGIGTARRHAV